jgi:hypothetical protein
MIVVLVAIVASLVIFLLLSIRNEAPTPFAMETQFGLALMGTSSGFL